MQGLRKSLDRTLSMAPEPEDPLVNKTYDVMKSTEEKLKEKEGKKKGELVLYTYATAAWCDVCGDFIWGFRKQAYKCKCDPLLLNLPCELE